MDTNRERVLQTIIDLTNARRPAARVLIAQLLNEKLSVVDDAVKRLREDGLVRTVVPGILEPVAQHPPSRPMSRTVLPDGRTKVEIGDELLTLTPHEAQMLGMMFAGDAAQLSTWTEERRLGEQVVRVESELRSMSKRFHELLRRSARRPGGQQPDLFADPTEAPRTRPKRGAHTA